MLSIRFSIFFIFKFAAGDANEGKICILQLSG